MQSYVVVLLTVFCYFFTAALVLFPNTLVLRAIFLPITLLLATSALESFDIIELIGDARLKYIDYIVGVMMVTVCMKVLDWTFCGREPLQRKSSTGKRMRSTFLKDVCDLSFNLRGIGWTWSRAYKPPPHTRPTSSTPRFLLYTLSSLVIHIVVADSLHFVVQSTDWTGFTNPQGTPLFNPSLAPIPRYLLSTFNSSAAGIAVYCIAQSFYDSATLIVIIFFNHSPVEWPPLFNEPWKSTSVADFWGNRWHQLFRSVFINLGQRPLKYIVGRKSGLSVFGGFIISGLLHSLGMWRMSERIDFILVGGYFIVQGLGVFLEAIVLKRLFGGKVDGWKGRIWAMTWVAVWTNMFVHSWSLHGFAASVFFPPAYRPSVMILDLVQNRISYFR